VVDVGDQKTSISCVEDGISHPETRIHLDYGGGDITQVTKSLNKAYLSS
jgi:actin-related protein 8